MTSSHLPRRVKVGVAVNKMVTVVIFGIFYIATPGGDKRSRVI